MRANDCVAEDEPGTADAFRRIWRHFGSSVGLIATEHESKSYAMLATAVTSVSMEPPSLLICINRSASAHLALRARRAFSVGILPASAAAIGAAIAKAKTADRLLHGDWRVLSAPGSPVDGLPWLAESQATIFCTLDTEVDYGSHTICIGKVDLMIGARGSDSLMYCDGRFGQFMEAGK